MHADPFVILTHMQFCHKKTFSQIGVSYCSKIVIKVMCERNRKLDLCSKITFSIE